MFVLSKTGEGREQCIENEEENPDVARIICRSSRNGQFHRRKQKLPAWKAEE